MFSMLSIGRKAVEANQKQLEVTAHNIANVNTPGFSRQRLIQEASIYIQDGKFNWGTGVDMVRVERMRDLQLDTEFRKQNSNTGYWNNMSKNLTELEKNILETSEFGINAMINGFFDSWESLSNNPFSNIHRMDVIDASQKMINSFQNLYRDIESKKKDIEFQLRTAADRINQIGEDMSELIKQIAQNKSMGKDANDLLDKFDLLLDELSTYGNVQVAERENGTLSVYLGTDELVRNNISQKLTYHARENLMSDGEWESFLAWDHDPHKEIGGLLTGSLVAMMDLKNKILPGYQEKLDNLVVQIAEQVNTIHKMGYTNHKPPSAGHDFFAPNCTGVMSFSLSKEVLADFDYIAASSIADASGDNKIALLLTDLRLAQTFDGQTLTEAFADIVYFIGNDVRLANQSAERSELISQQTDNFRESVKGVSLNEETANLIKFQQAYQAASKIISVADDMFKTILGLVR